MTRRNPLPGIDTTMIHHTTMVRSPWVVFTGRLPWLAPADSYGEGCAGTTGVPALELSRPPYLGTTPTLALDNSQAPTPTAGALLVGISRVAVPVLGCTLLVTPIVALPVAVGASGFSNPLALPGDPILTGVKLDFQGIVLDANAIGGASFSPGLELTLGGL